MLFLFKLQLIQTPPSFFFFLNHFYLSPLSLRFGCSEP